jgi:hypothetical protein
VSPTEQRFVATALGGSGRIIPSPFQFYVTGEDHLLVTIWSSSTSAGAGIRVLWRAIDTRGESTANQRDFPVDGSRFGQRHFIELPPSVIVGLSVSAIGFLEQMGRIFVTLALQRGTAVNEFPHTTLLQGFVGTRQTISWPNSPIQMSLEGPGVIRQITGTQPGLAAEIVEQVPGGARWELLSFWATLTTSAVAANRFPQLSHINNSGTAYAFVTSPIATTAGLVKPYIWFPEAGTVDASPISVILPWRKNHILMQADHLQTATVGMQGGDQWSAPKYEVREWMEGEP